MDLLEEVVFAIESCQFADHKIVEKICFLFDINNFTYNTVKARVLERRQVRRVDILYIFLLLKYIDLKCNESV